MLYKKKNFCNRVLHLPGSDKTNNACADVINLKSCVSNRCTHSPWQKIRFQSAYVSALAIMKEDFVSPRS